MSFVLLNLEELLDTSVLGSRQAVVNFFLELKKFELLEPTQVTGRPKSLSTIDRLFMFFMWMRHSISFHVFAVLTNLNERTCRDYCRDILEIMYSHANKYDCFFVFFFSNRTFFF